MDPGPLDDPSPEVDADAPSSGSPDARRAEARGRGRDWRLLASGALGAAWITLPPLAGLYILYDLASIAEFLKTDLDHGFWAYVAVFAITAGLGLLPTYSQAFLGGWVFGLSWGLAGAIMGFTGAAAIGYLFSRMVTGRSVDAWIDRHPRGRVIRDALARGSRWRTFAVVTLVRLPPSSPFAMTNYMLGATGVPFWLAMVATPIGMLPRTAIVCFLAASAVSAGASDLVEVYRNTPTWVLVSGIVASVAVVAILGQLATRALEGLASGVGRP